MSATTFKFEVSIDIDSAVKTELTRILGTSDATEFKDRLASMAATALVEYVDMFIGAEPLTTAAELRERRLMRLIHGVFEGRMPGVAVIAAIFGKTPTAAGNFIRSTVAKRRAYMGGIMMATLKAALGAAGSPEKDGSRLVVITEAFLVSELNDLLRASGKSTGGVRSEKESLTKYRIDKDSFAYLQKRLA